MSAPEVFPVPTHRGRGTGTAPDRQRIEHGSKLFTDIAALLDGGLPEPPRPVFLTRDDGHAILYAGQVSCMFGEAESGKTFIVLAAIAEVAKANRRTVFIDIDHNGVDATVSRLLALGVAVEYLADPALFRYWAPEDRDELLALVAFLRTWRPSIVAVDSVGELLPLLGLNSNSPDDFTTAHAAVLKPLATVGAAVVIIDHLAKNTDSKAAGPTGTAAKRRAVGGVSIRVTIKDQFVPGKGGSAWLTVNKDRHGGLRQFCPRGDREPSAGLFTLEHLGDRLVWNLRAPSDVDAGLIIGVAPADLDALSKLEPPPESVRDVKERMGWGSTRATKALEAWRSRSVPEERGTPEPVSVPRSYTPMSGNGEQAEQPTEHVGTLAIRPRGAVHVSPPPATPDWVVPHECRHRAHRGRLRGGHHSQPSAVDPRRAQPGSIGDGAANRSDG